MYSVTSRIESIKQPRGGYINLSDFEQEVFVDNEELSENENIHASTIGLVVDYLTRFIMGTDKNTAFAISLLGAEKAEKLGNKGSIKAINNYLNNIDGLDDVSIINACRAVSYDVWFRNPINAFNSKKGEDINPDKETINNIRILINRSVSFWNEHGPITSDGFTFEGGGYTNIISSGDGDFLTNDTLWDFKVSKNKPTPAHTLQILIYYIMGIHSGKSEFKNIDNIGIFNPRLNIAYTLSVNSISEDIIHTIEKDVIGYDTDDNIDISNDDEILDIKELSKTTGLSKYTIMNMYKYYGLPLKKEKNKYVISKSSFDKWYDEYKSKQMQAIIIYIVIGLVVGLGSLLFLLAS